MKKTAIYLLAVLMSCISMAQSSHYVLYPPEHIDDYILPSALKEDGGCLFSISDTLHPGPCIPLRTSFWQDRYIIAIPYYSDTLVSIYGIGILGSKVNASLPNPLFQIRDSLPDNILRSKTANFQASYGIEPNAYTEVFFDTPITVQGLYHISLEFETYDGADTYFIKVINQVLFFGEVPTPEERCGKCNSDYAPLYKQRGDSAWHAYPHATANTPYVYGIDGYYTIPMMFPIRGDLVLPSDTVITDTASSALRMSLLNEESVRVYPNPASDVLNVASNYNILNIAIFDAMNRLVEEREVNAKNIRISLAKRPSGVYFIKVRTDRGSTMRKFVIR